MHWEGFHGAGCQGIEDKEGHASGREFTGLNINVQRTMEPGMRSVGYKLRWRNITTILRNETHGKSNFYTQKKKQSET